MAITLEDVQPEVDVLDFLTESNAIEAVYDSESLDTAVSAWIYLIDNYELTADIILQTHDILMQDHLWDSQRGCLRKVDVTVGGATLPHYYELKPMLDAWIKKANYLMKFPHTRRSRENISRSMHIEFEKMHPFVDGNGRIGRMLMNWWRLWTGMPVLILRESEKQDYYKWFR